MAVLSQRQGRLSDIIIIEEPQSHQDGIPRLPGISFVLFLVVSLATFGIQCWLPSPFHLADSPRPFHIELLYGCPHLSFAADMELITARQS